MKHYDDALPVATIYAAENNVAAAVKKGSAVQFLGGSTLDLDRCRIRNYSPAQIDLLRGMVGGLYYTFRNKGTRQQSPDIRISTRAYRRAWYNTATHEIVLPASQWAFNDMVLAHEIAHACSASGHDQRSAHGVAWRKTYAAIVAEVIGREAALLLQAALDL